MSRLVDCSVPADSWYVPDIDDNRQDKEPFAVQLKPLNGARYREIETKILGATKVKDIGDSIANAYKLLDTLVEEHVTAVRNYSFNGSVPTNGKELVATIKQAPISEAAIIEDIVRALKDPMVFAAGALK